MVQTTLVVAASTQNLAAALTKRQKHEVCNMKVVTAILFNLDVVLMDILLLSKCIR